jgi:ubiquinone/menaquinone biosynthesis C-methylase UbiE
MTKDPNRWGKEIYDRRAKRYDKEASMMERMIGSSRRIFNTLRGNILEIGTGTGINLPYYHSQAKVIAIDWSPEMVKIAKRKKEKHHLTQIVAIEQGDAQILHQYFISNSFHFVVSTCVFCSIPDPIKALGEVKQIIKNEGYFIQIEHGISRFSLLNLLMKFFDLPIYKLTGTHIARNHIQNLNRSGFRIIKIRPMDPLGIMNIIISKAY